MASAGALARWEPRIRVDRIRTTAVDVGTITIAIEATDTETRTRLELNNLELPFK
ncbi:hypothetical protein D3C75_972000 [compost metagenome]